MLSRNVEANTRKRVDYVEEASHILHDPKNKH